MREGCDMKIGIMFVVHKPTSIFCDGKGEAWAIKYAVEFKIGTCQSLEM